MTDNDQYYSDGLILIEDNRIIYAGPRIKLPQLTGEMVIEKIDGTGKIALPGFIDAHLHMALNITKGFVEDIDFKDILFEVLYPAEASLRGEEVYYSCLVGGLEALKQGATTLIDHYHHGDITEEVVHKLGVRAELSLMAQDFDLANSPMRNKKSGWIENFYPEYGMKELEENLRLAKAALRRNDPLIRWRIGINTPDTVSEITLVEASEIMQREGLGGHIHLAQSKSEQLFSRNRWGCTSVEFLNQIGLLDTNLIAAHCTVLTNKDIDILASSKTIIAHCPISNAKGGPVIAPIPDLLAKGAKVALGTDSTPADMLEVIRYTSIINKLPYGDTTVMPALQALKLATIDAARAIGRETEIGSLEPGKLADIILIDVMQSHLQPMEDIPCTLVYNAHGRDISMVIVDGRIVIRNGFHTTIDELDVLKTYKSIAQKFWQRNGFSSTKAIYLAT